MTLHLEIITPEKVILNTEANEVVVPTVEGQIDILPNHITLLSQLAHGELIVKKDNSQQYLAVEGGFVEVGHNKVTILADYAVREEDIEISKAEAAQKRAKDLMEKKITAEDFAEAQAQLRRSLLELRVAERRKHTSRRPS